jgi:hypothetical protein
MRFERHTVVLLVRPPDAPELSPADADALQDAHLAFRAGLRDQGYILGGGPLVEQDDERRRGFSVMSVDPATAGAVQRRSRGSRRAARRAGDDLDGSGRQHPLRAGASSAPPGRSVHRGLRTPKRHADRTAATVVSAEVCGPLTERSAHGPEPARPLAHRPFRAPGDRPPARGPASSHSARPSGQALGSTQRAGAGRPAADRPARRGSDHGVTPSRRPAHRLEGAKGTHSGRPGGSSVLDAQRPARHARVSAGATVRHPPPRCDIGIFLVLINQLQGVLSQRRISPVTTSGASWWRKWPASGIRRHS